MSSVRSTVESAAAGGPFGGAVVLALIPMRWLHHCPAEDPGPRVAAMAEATPSRPLTPVERTMPPGGPAPVSGEGWVRFAGAMLLLIGTMKRLTTAAY
jgi:hypothetical protein